MNKEMKASERLSLALGSIYKNGITDLDIQLIEEAKEEAIVLERNNDIRNKEIERLEKLRIVSDKIYRELLERFKEERK